jgi:hypothetical protein
MLENGLLRTYLFTLPLTVRYSLRQKFCSCQMTLKELFAYSGKASNQIGPMYFARQIHP